MNKKQKRALLRIIIAAAVVVILNLLKLPAPLPMLLYLAAYLTVGYDVLRKAWNGLAHGRPFDENYLMAVATIGAIALTLYEKTGDFNEAVAVMLFYQIGEFFQSVAVGKSRRNIAELMDIRPDYANVEENGSLQRVDPEEVEIGTVIVIQPGEKVPIDGIVIEGNGSLDTAALTGESVPREIKPGEEILSGCISLSGVLRIQTTREFGESTVSKILELVENASSRKSRSEEFISRFARIYTPAVVYGAIALGIIPPLVRQLALGLSADWNTWIYRALTFLVISCPCALVISIPLSFFAGIGGAGHEGILIKGANFLEALAQVKTVVFDKTGTLTRGDFEVSGVHHCSMEEEKLIEYAALAECASSHPISRSLQRAHGRETDRSRVQDIEEISGHGVVGTVDGHHIAAGNEKMMKRMGLEWKDCHSPGTLVHMAVDGEYAGHILISDTVKPGAAEAVRELRRSGIEKTVMLTGDKRAAAEAVAKELGIDEIHAELLPEDKVRMMEKLLGDEHRGKVAFVGDGINDAPVLTRADVGIAMGALGSDAAIEAADVVLMDDDPRKIAAGIRISRKCIRIVYENIIFALAVKFGCLLLGALGITNMWAAIFADVGVMILAVLNAVRALRIH